jgi:hypothetical protein
MMDKKQESAINALKRAALFDQPDFLYHGE